MGVCFTSTSHLVKYDACLYYLYVWPLLFFSFYVLIKPVDPLRSSHLDMSFVMQMLNFPPLRVVYDQGFEKRASMSE